MKREVNPKAPVIERKEIEIKAPVESVWKVLTDIKRWPEWQENVKSAKLKGKGEVAEGREFVWKAGGLSFHSQLHTVEPQQAFGRTGKIMGAFAIHNWTLSEKKDNTIVTVEESLEGFFPSLMKKSFQKNLSAGMEKSLKELKQASEGSTNKSNS
ncbi:uncharacterized protein YndB with AHSA1/START domain [Catalinimonas alkaloidigena]|uniref:SRPBCC family protein n=1 Tax=Catalinimonas alkaloidigena TaxID=1075417 RepID=UPI0024076628|nr:SRPBCC family protein [Catalinimonas alkaloidigena]MDF9798056.1 uncharacterized protein YndB with AHSA1/START domain [Catalinimonas alkaloidigena]